MDLYQSTLRSFQPMKCHLLLHIPVKYLLKIKKKKIHDLKVF